MLFFKEKRCDGRGKAVWTLGNYPCAINIASTDEVTLRYGKRFFKAEATGGRRTGGRRWFPLRDGDEVSASYGILQFQDKATRRKG